MQAEVLQFCTCPRPQGRRQPHLKEGFPRQGLLIVLTLQKKLNQWVHYFLIWRLSKKLLIDHFRGYFPTACSNDLSAFLESSSTHLDDPLRLRDVRFADGFRVFGADLHRFFERFVTRQFSKKAAPSLKDPLA